MKNIHLICAARPNFMKIAPLYHTLKDENWCDVKIVHTGQHYDTKMSQAFFDDLELPAPDYYLGIGSGSHAEQTAKTMIAYEELSQKDKPDLVIVVGDVNATLACAIVAKKLHLKLAHLEAGLRSHDKSMPEEINRIVTDAISDYHWTPSEDANENLLKEGVCSDQIAFVGNIMIDTYCMLKDKIDERQVWEKFGFDQKSYAILTLHRPVNVDSPETLRNILDVIVKIDFPIIFPVHPRTIEHLSSFDNLPDNIVATDPFGYIDFMNLVSNAAYVISDSGGIQEETTCLGVPCYTLRDSTERPITVSMGSNQLVNTENLIQKLKIKKESAVPPLWDGKTASRIKDAIKIILF